ncbi:MAG: hypothetical protein ACPL4K_05870 [Candidatus Margulisiibacteriota bacterium]
MSNLKQALVGQVKKIKKLVFVSPIFFPSQLGLKTQRTKAGNIVGYHRKFTFIKTFPSANWVYDTVLALRGTACKIIVFVGTAAGISKNWALGEIISYESGAKVKSLNSFWQETKLLVRNLRNQGYHAIDFELEHFLKACRRIGRQAKFLLLIEDFLPEKPFYKISSRSDKEKIKKGKENLLAQCKTLAQNL